MRNKVLETFARIYLSRLAEVRLYYSEMKNGRNRTENNKPKSLKESEEN